MPTHPTHPACTTLPQEAEGGSADLSANEPVEIYGPEGIRDMVRAVIQLSYSHVVPPHRIHELKNLTSMPGKCVVCSVCVVRVCVCVCVRMCVSCVLCVFELPRTI